jgi:hypothetical protein
MRVGVLINDDVSVWERAALRQACADHEVFLLQSSGWTPKRSMKHALYYALNSITVRNRLTRRVPFPDDIKVADRVRFEPTYDGIWAVLPSDLLDWVRAKQIDVIVKFGLGLMRVPEGDELNIPVLSFHHGDPRRYRGRPAGFYEMLAGEPFMGQIVQAIGPKLDAGTVYAFTESRVVPHSYRKTLIESYRLSPHLLKTALNNVALDRPLAFECNGRNYRLPSNGTVLRFIAGRAVDTIKRLVYGAVLEKRWRVATCQVASDQPMSAIAEVEDLDWNVLRIADGYTFYADPFFASGDDILVEALNTRRGKGEIIRVRGDRHERLDGFAGHVSYPAIIRDEVRDLMVPETASWSRLAAYEINERTADKVFEFAIDEAGIGDPTFFRHDGHWYLFGNAKADGTSVLHLWHADNLRSRFARHPASPIRVSARGSRMAGNIATWSGEIYRLGQDWRRGYGDGILAFRIRKLSPTEYEEDFAGEARFSRTNGPHTLNRRGTTLLFDFYTERFSPLAGIRRVLNKL